MANDESVSTGTEGAEVAAVAATDANRSSGLPANVGPSYESGPHLADPAIRDAYRRHLLKEGVRADDPGLTEEMAAILNEPAE